MNREEQAAALARLIKRSSQGTSWCSTQPLTIARYLLTHGVLLPAPETEKK